MKGKEFQYKRYPPLARYSESFKRQVVREYEQGFLNKDQLTRKYQIAGHSMVLHWCRRYGKFAYHSPNKNGSPVKDLQKRRIGELEKKLKAAQDKIRVYEKLIEVTNRELDADVIKKIEAKLSRNWQQKKR